MWKNVLLFWLICCLCISVVYNISHIRPRGSRTVNVTMTHDTRDDVQVHDSLFSHVDYIVYSGDQKLKHYLKSCGALESQFTTSRDTSKPGLYFICLNDAFEFKHPDHQISNDVQNVKNSFIQWSHIVLEGSMDNVTSTLFGGLCTGTIHDMRVYLYNSDMHIDRPFIYKPLSSTQHNKPQCLAMIEGCAKREAFSKKQCKWLCDMEGVESFYVLGNEHQSRITIDIVDHKVVVPCKDNYLNLCQKSFFLYKAANILIQNNTLFDQVACVLKTDDDIEIKNHLIHWMKPHMNQYMYWGNVRHKKAHASDHFMKRAQESKAFRDEIKNKYPQLLDHKVWIDKVDYTNGGCTIIHKNAIHHILNNPDLFIEMPENQLLENYKKDNYMKNIPAFEDVCVGMALSRSDVYPTHVNIKPVFHWDGL